ncbi:MAG: DUF4968 domain-containing protein [Clostridia bacterium]|nr:DUF4968 domain-containing protein [Clostridia bacterium]
MARFSIVLDAVDKQNTIVVNDVRISVLSSRILRVEMANEGHFCDLPSQAVFNRKFQNPQFTHTVCDDKVSIVTKNAEFVVSTKTLDVDVKLAGTDRFVRPTKGAIWVALQGRLTVLLDICFLGKEKEMARIILHSGI